MLIPLALVYEIFILRNHALNHYFYTTLQLHNSPVDCARQLFKPSKDAASLWACNEKKFDFWVFSFFVSDLISGVDIWPFWLRLPGPGHQPQEEVFCSSFCWKLGWNPSLLSLWSAFYYFWFKSYGL